MEWTMIIFFNSKTEIRGCTADENSKNTIVPSVYIKLVDKKISYNNKENIIIINIFH